MACSRWRGVLVVLIEAILFDLDGTLLDSTFKF